VPGRPIAIGAIWTTSQRRSIAHYTAFVHMLDEQGRLGSPA